MEKLTEKICVFCAECKELYGSKVVYNDQISLHTLKRLRKKLLKNLLKSSKNTLISFMYVAPETAIQRQIRMQHS